MYRFYKNKYLLFIIMQFYFNQAENFEYFTIIKSSSIKLFSVDDYKKIFEEVDLINCDSYIKVNGTFKISKDFFLLKFSKLKKTYIDSIDKLIDDKIINNYYIKWNDIIIKNRSKIKSFNMEHRRHRVIFKDESLYSRNMNLDEIDIVLNNIAFSRNINLPDGVLCIAVPFLRLSVEIEKYIKESYSDIAETISIQYILKENKAYIDTIIINMKTCFEVSNNDLIYYLNT